MRLRNRSADTPVGWKFKQPQISPKDIVAHSFALLVREVVKLRRANPGLSKQYALSTDVDAVSAEVEEFVAARCKAAGYDGFITDGGPNAPFPQAPQQWQHLQSGGNAAGAGQPSKPPSWFRSLGQVGTGLRTLADWLGSEGKPVANELSSSRAGTCSNIDGTGKMCPKNLSGDLTSFFTKPASELIRRQLSERNDLKLTTPYDDKLGVCDACGCPLKLKVHCPVEFILAHIPKGGEADLDPRCWILKEKK